MLAAIGRLLRRSRTPPADVLEAYAHEVIPVLDRAEWLYQYWLDQSTLFSDGEKLGNVAAIHRWEAATMERSLERVTPPTVLADGKDLFGMPQPSGASMGCRMYEGGVPDVSKIAERLQKLRSE